MLPEVGATELMLIAAVALIVVGPKDLPMLLRKIGEFMGKMRRMASDFRASFDDMARQSELDDLRKEVEAMRSAAQAQITESASAMDRANFELDNLISDAPPATLSPDEQEMLTAYDYTAPAPEPAKPPRKAAPRKAAKPKAAPSKAATPAAPAKRSRRKTPSDA